MMRDPSFGGSFGHSPEYARQLRADADAADTFAEYVALRHAGGHDVPGYISPPNQKL